MTPIYEIDCGDPIGLKERNELFYEHRHTRLFRAMMQTFREEAFSCLAESMTAKAQDKDGLSELMLGGFMQISKVVGFVQERSQIAPAAPE